MIKKGNRYSNEIFPNDIYIDVDDSEYEGDVLPELSIYIKLAVLCIKNNMQFPHANNKNIGELCKFLKEFTTEVVQVELPPCIANYKPVVIKPKAKPNRARQKDINEVKKNLFK